MLLKDWSPLHNLNVNEGYALLLDHINDSMNILAPYKERLIPPNNIIQDPWMSKSFLICPKKCHLLYKKSIGLPKSNDEVIRYIRYRNAYNRLKLSSKCDYIKDQLVKFKNNSRQIWATIRYITDKTNEKSSTLHEMKIDGEFISEKQQIADNFNKHFGRVGRNFNFKIPNSSRSFRDYL